MKLHAGSRMLGLGLVAAMLLLATLACSIAGGDDDQSDSTPTIQPSASPATSAVGMLSSPTPFPSPTQRPLATATQFVLPRINTPIPTWTPFVQPATPLPYDVRISYPVDGGQIAGYVTVTGSASHPRFLQYALEWGPEPNPSNLWYPITAPRPVPVLNSILGAWNTTSVPDGSYRLRLHVWLSDGTDTAFVVGGIRVSNVRPTAIPTATQTQRPNQIPQISPIANQRVEAGQAARIPIQSSDPDGDAILIFASSNNPAVATTEVVSPSEIIVRGVTAGSAVVTVSVNDNRGGASSAAFAVTVSGQNRAPSISPIVNQTIEAGQTKDIAVQVSDPDGDAITLSAISSDNGVVLASAPNAATVRLAGQAQGNASVTVTANDGRGGVVSTVFLVTVGLANRPPAVDPVGEQLLMVGETRDVAYNASDPDNDPLAASAVSNNPGVVAASVTGPGVIRLVAGQPGIATVVLTVQDNRTAPVTVQFAVTVQQPNRPPAVDAIGPQSITAGESLNVPYNAVDPDGDTLTATAQSDDSAVVEAQVNASGNIALSARQAGAATVTLSVSDGHNAPVEVSFQVTVGAVNEPPILLPLDQQFMTVGDVLDLAYVASDPNGDRLGIEVISDNASIASAEIPAAGTLRLHANGAGQATITLSVSDGVNPPAVVSFFATVSAANESPAVEPVGEQRLNVGETINVPINATDPNADPLTLAAVSDNPAVASAVAAGMQIAISGNAEGTATITADVSDGRGGLGTVTFLVIVEGQNSAPVIEPVAEQTLAAGETIEVPVSVSDADGDAIVLSAISQDQTVATASASGTTSVTLTGVGAGTTTVELTADDALGGVTIASFTVNVSSAAPSFDLNAYPVIPQIDQQSAAMLAQVFQSGARNFGNQAGAFSKVGDESVASDQFLAPFAGDQYNLDNFQALQGLIDLYRATPVRADDPAANSLNVDSVAAEAGFAIDSLSAPAPSSGVCASTGAATVLGCEFAATRPAVALISFSAPNVTFMNPDQFRSELQVLVTDSLSQYGVIPVLATIPAGGNATTEQLAEYNRAIVEVATQSGVPLWNLWRAMQERGISDPFSVAPEGAGNLTDPALSFGYNVRNLTALQTLQAVRQAAGIQ